MSAVVEEIEQPTISQPAKAVVFAARREDLRLIKVPRYPQRGASGQQVGETVGEALQFRRGLLEVPTDGDVTLEDGRSMAGPEIISWLEKHRLFNNKDEGFFRVEIAAPAPSEAEMNALVMAATALDEDRMAEIIREEEAGWGREAILNVARQSLEHIAAFREKAQAEAAAKPEPKPKAEPKE